MLVLYNTDKMPIGKYRGKLVSEIIDKDPHYVSRFNEDNVAFCDDIMMEVGRLTSNRTKKPKSFNIVKSSYNNVLNTKTN